MSSQASVASVKATFTDRVVESLINDGLVTKEQADEIIALHRQHGGKLLRLFVEKKLVSEDDMMVTMGRVHGTPPVNLYKFHVGQELIELIPKDVALAFRMVVVSRIGKRLFVAMADPLNVNARDELKRLFPEMTVVPMISYEKAVTDTINNLGGRFKGGIDELLKGSEGLDVENVTENLGEIDLDQMSNDSEQGPVIKVVNLLLVQALKERASDIHIEPFERSMRVRYRVDGVLIDSQAPPKTMQAALASRIKIMANLNIAERRLPQDGRFRIRISGKDVDLRVSFLPCAHGEKIVLRVLDKGGLTSSLDSLQAGKKAQEDLRNAIDQPHGMLLMTGPTGSGKTTTLYCILQELNKADVNLITIEDPIEYQLAGINQVQVKPDIGLTFASGLRSILRQDPDIVMVGEIRDGETADIAVKAALTGHLVLSTLHTNDAAGAVTRLVDMGVEPFLVSSSLILTCAQRLVRRICQNCKTEFQLPKDVLERLSPQQAEEFKNATFFRGQGCSRCKNTGYWGRLAILEVLPVTPEIRQAILRNANAAHIKQLAVQQGMDTLRVAGLHKAKEGLTTIEEVLRVTAGDH
jgi:type IV pilus assembly protein PilB